MSLLRTEFWLTHVPRDESVIPSLVLAESLRRTGTIRRIGVIVSEAVSHKAQLKLLAAFDHVFHINNGFTSFRDEKLRGKCYAFSLSLLHKCVFVAANSVALENCDMLFKEEWKAARTFSGKNWDIFGLTPNAAFCQYLCRRAVECSNNFNLTGVIEAWLKTHGHEIDNSLAKDLVWKLSLETGRLKNLQWLNVLKPGLVNFRNAPDSDNALVSKMESIEKAKTIGLTEQSIICTWLKTFEGPVNTMLCQSDVFSLKKFELWPICQNEPIAIIGMSCRFPNASNLKEFWKLMYAGKEAIRKPPTFRWTKDQTDYRLVHLNHTKTEAGFLKDPVDGFDAKFFGISPFEAVMMDPQSRLLHEVMWEALENGAINPQSLYGSNTGIFTGSWLNHYEDLVQSRNMEEFYRTYLGNSFGALAARLSFLLGATGPSIATESGCSSGMVAVDLAVKSLRNWETNLAISGAVNLLIRPFNSSMMEKIISPSNRCKSFDESADGFGRAEGCGVLVLKRLSDAQRDRDNVWAVIRGSAVSQEGISRSLGTPTVHCEAMAMKLALKDGEVLPEQVSFVETHGTGTAVGDPMEVAAIAEAYHSKARTEPLVIGSVKTNVGHTESCSGITGIIKTVLSLQNELIPKHLNLTTLNPEVKLEKIPAQIPLEPIEWKKVPGCPRLAGVSSFGITGTDGHVILEEAPEYSLPKFCTGLQRPLHLIKFSGKTNDSLDKLLSEYAHSFENNQYALEDAAYTVNVGRASFEYRAFILARNLSEAANILASGGELRGNVVDSKKSICFLFTGQGSQYSEMARLLYETSPVFRLHFDQCDAILRETHDLFINKIAWEKDLEPLSQTVYSQTTVFTIEYCLLKLWESWGIKPDYVLGHSLGEFCAAVAAGIITLEDALLLVANRSRLIDGLPQGKMLVINANYSVVANLLELYCIDLDFAAVNTLDQTVVAGDTDVVTKFMNICTGEGLKSTILNASHAFHSRHMEPMLGAYGNIAAKITVPAKATCHYISGVEGKLLENPCEEISAEYWVRHTRDKVCFSEACQVLQKLKCQDFVEIGPHPVLSSFVSQNLKGTSVLCCPSLRRRTNDWCTILNSLGKLYLQGYSIDWEGFDKPYARIKVPNLPTYPFNRKSYWIDCLQQHVVMDIHPLVGHLIASATTERIFENDISLKALSYLKDHSIGKMIVFPGAGYTEMCLAAGFSVAYSLNGILRRPNQSISVENVRFDWPLEINKKNNCRMQTVVSFNEKDGFECRVYHHQPTEECVIYGGIRDWVLHASAKFCPFVGTDTPLREQCNSDKIKSIICNQSAVQGEVFYKYVNATGLKLGKQFQTIQQIWIHSEVTGLIEVVVKVHCPEQHDKYILHPLLIDAMMQTVVCSQMGGRLDFGTNFFVPYHIGKFTLITPLDLDETTMYFYAKQDKLKKSIVFACSNNLTPIAVMQELNLIETNAKLVRSRIEQHANRIPDSWKETWKVIPGPFDFRLKLGGFKLNNLFSADNFVKKWDEISKTITAKDVANFVRINKLVYLYTLKAFIELGWEPKTNDQLQIDTFCKRHQIQLSFKQLIHYYLNMFMDHQEIFKMVREDQKNGTPVWKITNVVCHNLLHTIDREKDKVYRELKEDSKCKIVADIYKNVGNYMSQIFRGNMSSLDILFPPEADPDYQKKQKMSAEAYYDNYPGTQSITAKLNVILETIIRHLGTHNDELKVYRILEVGSGTGVQCSRILEIFAKFWPKIEYYFTDISSAFFTKGEKKFAKDIKLLTFASFDIEAPPFEQGIPLNYFDLVVASDVLHATRNLKETLTNIRQTLKPEGILWFIETFSSTIDRGLTCVFGLLPGYWRFRDFNVRPDHCCVNGPKWKNLLLDTGFEDVHIFDMFCESTGGVMAIASKEYGWNVPNKFAGSNERQEEKTWLLFFRNRDVLVDKLEKVLSNSGMHTKLVLPNTEIIKSEEQTKNWISSLLISSNVRGIIYAWSNSIAGDQREISLPFLYIAKCLLNMQNPPKLCVVTRGIYGLTEGFVNLDPCGATLVGMSKSLKNEQGELFVRCLDLEDYQGIKDVVVNVDQIIFEFTSSKEARQRERIQVVYRDQTRYEARFSRTTLGENPAKLDLKPPTYSKRFKVLLPETRVFDDLKFAPLEEMPLGLRQVEVAVKAYALNFRDILTVLKPSKHFENYSYMGLDFSGIITKVGSEVPSSELKLGDRVYGINLDEIPMPSHLVKDAEALAKLPDTMSYGEGVTFPAVLATALQCLHVAGKMKAGDWVLIHTASGGVGLSAIQLVKLAQANVITTAGSPRKRAYLRSLGIRHVFNSRDTSYLENIMRVTKGRGVDLVLNSLTGPGFKEATLTACAKNARFIEMSKMNIWCSDDVKLLRPDVFYTVENLEGLGTKELYNLFNNVEVLVSNNSVSSIPYTQFDALRIREAMKYFQQAKHIGKIVISFPTQDAVGGQWNARNWIFNDRSTYIITGGMGGIGFVVCKWMLERGAINIVLVGRNSPNSETLEEIKVLNMKGFKIIVKLADVGNATQCKALIDDITTTYKMPIRGIQHCAGVLRDNLYANQRWEDFEYTFNSKVNGTWNLHKSTINMRLEHFVVHSSLAALVGTAGQPNHAAANCFEDAFVHYRHALGLPGTSINWGQWATVGVAREINVGGLLPVNYIRMLNGLEEAMRSHCRQVAIGEFESVKAWISTCPTLKYYVDDKIRQVLTINQEKRTQDSQASSEKFWAEMHDAVNRDSKMEIANVHLKCILRNLLRMEDDETISNDANLQDLGVDSLLVIEVRNCIQSLLGSGVTVPVNILKDCRTVNDLSNAIVCSFFEDGENSFEQEPKVLTELLQQDIILDESIQPSTKHYSISNSKVILVTGCTGQVAPYVIRTLSNASFLLVKIVCLVKRKPGVNPENRLENMLKEMNHMRKINLDKIESIFGDVTLPDFELGVKAYGELVNSVDAVFHLAVKSSQTAAYKVTESGGGLRSVNVCGLINVLRFASTGKTKHIFFPSTLDNAFLNEFEDDRLSEMWPKESQLQLLINNNNGYMISKWVGEILIKQAVQRNIPCKVFRFGNMLGDSQTGHLNYGSNNHILRFMSYMKLKTMPDYPMPLLGLPVDICVEMSVKLFLRDDVPSDIYNIIHPNPQIEPEFAEMVKEVYGIKVELDKQWQTEKLLGRLTASGVSLGLSNQICAEFVNLNMEKHPAILGFYSNPRTFFVSEKIKKYFPDFLENVPVSMEIMKKTLDYVKTQGFFKKFGIPILSANA